MGTGIIQIHSNGADEMAARIAKEMNRIVLYSSPDFAVFETDCSFTFGTEFCPGCGDYMSWHIDPRGPCESWGQCFFIEAWGRLFRPNHENERGGPYIPRARVHPFVAARAVAQAQSDFYSAVKSLPGLCARMGLDEACPEAIEAHGIYRRAAWQAAFEEEWHRIADDVDCTCQRAWEAARQSAAEVAQSVMPF